MTKNFFSTNWVLSERYEANQSSADPITSQTLQLCSMRDGIKSNTEVKENEDGEKAGICCYNEIIGDFDLGFFCAVT